MKTNSMRIYALIYMIIGTICFLVSGFTRDMFAIVIGIYFVLKSMIYFYLWSKGMKI